MKPALVDGVFPVGAAVAWQRMEDEVAQPFPEEQALIARAVPKRQREFAVGRACARRALAELGCEPKAILSGERREPLWPPGVVGSITHDRAFGLAVVGYAERFRGLGADIEPDEPLSPQVAARIWSAEEAAAAAGSGVIELATLPKLVFAIKEAVYKCQFPLSKQYLGFGAVTVTLGRERFDAVLNAAAGPLAAGFVFSGQWRRAEGELLAGVWLERE
jgi:4'-phosphopantetheinyl transferase EntD